MHAHVVGSGWVGLGKLGWERGAASYTRWLCLVLGCSRLFSLASTGFRPIWRPGRMVAAKRCSSGGALLLLIFWMFSCVLVGCFLVYLLWRARGEPLKRAGKNVDLALLNILLTFVWIISLSPSDCIAAFVAGSASDVAGSAATAAAATIAVSAAAAAFGNAA